MTSKPSPPDTEPETLDTPPHPLPPIKRLSPREPSTGLKDKVAILTGCSSPLGIGRATAHVFAHAHISVLYLTDLSPSNLTSLRHELLSLPPTHRSSNLQIHLRTLDASSAPSIASLCAHALTTHSRLDIFFANAGIATALPIALTTPETFINTLKINTLSVFLAIKYAAEAMKQTSASKPNPGGSIIATASVAALRSNAGSADYSASKAAVLSLVQTAAYQFSGPSYNVKINAVLPGLIETGMTRSVFEGARKRGTEGKIGQVNPMGRGGGADEVARVVGFLARGEGYVTGQGWAVDGGLSAGLPFVRGKLA